MKTKYRVKFLVRRQCNDMSWKHSIIVLWKGEISIFKSSNSNKCNLKAVLTLLVVNFFSFLRCTIGWMNVCWLLQKKPTETWATFKAKSRSTRPLKLKSKLTRRDWITSARLVLSISFQRWRRFISDTGYLLEMTPSCNPERRQTRSDCFMDIFPLIWKILRRELKYNTSMVF